MVFHMHWVVFHTDFLHAGQMAMHVPVHPTSCAHFLHGYKMDHTSTHEQWQLTYLIIYNLKRV